MAKNKLNESQLLGLDLLDLLINRRNSYDKINKMISEVDDDGDFPTFLNVMPSDILTSIMGLLDQILLPGDELASYFFWECQSMKDGGSITVKSGREFKIKTIADLKKYLLAQNPEK